MYESTSKGLREWRRFEELRGDSEFLGAVEKKEWKLFRSDRSGEQQQPIYSLDDARMSIRYLTHGKIPKFDLRRDARQLPLNMLNSRDPWPEIEKLIKSGWSLVVNSERNSKCSLKMLSDALETFFGRRTQLNTYYTPVASRCFKTHVDDHDVVVFQVTGEKYWEIYPFAEWVETDKGGHWELPRVEVEPVFAGTLQAGDVLYLPEGFPHRANCGDHPSLHLTFGIRRKSSSWKGLLVDSAEALLQGNLLDTTYVPRVTRPAEDVALRDLDQAMEKLKEGMAQRILKELREPSSLVFDPTEICAAEIEEEAARFLSEEAANLVMDHPLDIDSSGSMPRLQTSGSQLTLKRTSVELLSGIPVGKPFQASDLHSDLSQDAAADLCRLLLLNRLAHPANLA